MRLPPSIVSPGIVLVGAVLLYGCASPRTGGEGTTRNVITAEEIADPTFHTASAWDAVQRLRPHWLRSRATISSGETSPFVFLDGSRFGDLQALRTIPVADVEEMRFLDSRDATTRFGTGYSAGVIEVSTRR